MQRKGAGMQVQVQVEEFRCFKATSTDLRQEGHNGPFAPNLKSLSGSVGAPFI